MNLELLTEDIVQTMNDVAIWTNAQFQEQIRHPERFTHLFIHEEVKQRFRDQKFAKKFNCRVADARYEDGVLGTSAKSSPFQRGDESRQADYM
jgi:hypothetical protein